MTILSKRTTVLLAGLSTATMVIAPSEGRQRGIDAELVPGAQIHELQPAPDPGQVEWVELRNRLDKSVDLGGFVLSFARAGLHYELPQALPLVPPGQFVLVYLDGLGATANDYDFSDGVAELHSPQPISGDVMDAAQDEVVIGLGAPISDRVRWGPEEATVGSTLATGPGLGGLGDIPIGGSVGVMPASGPVLRLGWTFYQPNETTPGAPNAVPAPIPFGPPDASNMLVGEVRLVWRTFGTGTERFQVQVAQDPSFQQPLIDVRVDGLRFGSTYVAGTYYWRVRRLDSSQFPSEWCARQAFTLAEAPEGPVPAADLGLWAREQIKDTNLICLQCEAETGSHAWDDLHDNFGCQHESNYCARTCVATIVQHYGGLLSADRISYEVFGGTGKHDTMGHGKTINAAKTQGILSWALRTPVIMVPGAPSWPALKNHIDSGRPLLIAIKNGTSRHALVIDGYTDPAGTANDLVHVLNSLTAQEVQHDFATYQPRILLWMYPVGTPNPRSNELGVTRDRDGDGLRDFDEMRTFDTAAGFKDTDLDCIEDKIEVRSYVWGLDALGLPRRMIGTSVFPGVPALPVPDAEIHEDEDGGGVFDGGEDRNRNGDLDSGESDPFIAKDDKTSPPSVSSSSTSDGFVVTITDAEDAIETVRVFRAVNLTAVIEPYDRCVATEVTVTVTLDDPNLPAEFRLGADNCCRDDTLTGGEWGFYDPLFLRLFPHQAPASYPLAPAEHQFSLANRGLDWVWMDVNGSLLLLRNPSGTLPGMPLGLEDDVAGVWELPAYGKLSIDLSPYFIPSDNVISFLSVGGPIGHYGDVVIAE